MRNIANPRGAKDPLVGLAAQHNVDTAELFDGYLFYWDRPRNNLFGNSPY